MTSETSWVRRCGKLVAFWVSLLLVSPGVFLVWVEKRVTRSEMLFTGFAQFLALFPGHAGVYLRSAFYYAALNSCDRQVHIGFGTVIGHRAAEISKGFSTGSFCVIGHAIVGPNVRMASRISIPSGKRQHLDDAGRLCELTIFEHVRIGRECWVGEGAIVMADVGERSIVSAGAVVTTSMPSDSVIGGNPARVLKALERRAHAQDGT